MNNPPYILVDEFETLVAAAGVAVGKDLNYQYGYLNELKETLEQYSKTLEFSAKKYPLVWLVQPFTIDRVNGDYFGDTSLRIFIIQESTEALKAYQRMADVYKPVIYPIYLRLLDQISSATHLFDGTMNDAIPHSVTDRYYWGEEQQEKIDDVFDCLEISGLKLKISNKKNCSILKSF